jgi:glycosyltransferase involved in cell wall biosynthesis
MKIHFDNVNLLSQTGPNTFATRLSNEFARLGHEIFTGSGGSADISLVFISASGNRLAKKVVQRLDGIWFSPDDFHRRNLEIKKQYSTADHVIWQSNFDREMITKWWGDPVAGSVISNGSSKTYKKSQVIEKQIAEIRNKYNTIFVSSANWHPQKRLNDNIRIFTKFRKYYTNSCLFILGAGAPPTTDKHIFNVGNQPHDVCFQLFESSDWMIHSAWLDHCPNSVVEALSCDLPVICSSDGGTKEIVGDYGIILNETVPYDFQLAFYDNPPLIDVDQIVSALPNRAMLGIHPDLSIEKCAADYLSVFRKIIGDTV